MDFELISTEDLYEDDDVVVIKRTGKAFNAVVDNIDVAIKNEDGDITNIVELKSKIVQIMNSTDKNSKYYNDLKWFSNINYTTTTEYFGELKLFLLDIVNLDEFKHYKSDLLDIINQISQILNWIYVTVI